MSASPLPSVPGRQPPDSAKTNKNRTRRRKPLKDTPLQGKNHTKKKDDSDSRFNEVSKLIKHKVPITINGIAVTKIVENHLAAEAPEEVQKSVSRKAKTVILCKHIEKIFKRDPQQALYLSFMMKPSDPDFPFELELLNFSLTIPAGYPRSPTALPTIVVLNEDIPRGFSLNIERGYRQIVALTKTAKTQETPDITLVDGKGLLSQVLTMDRYLEAFLLQEKQKTMKFVTFKSKKQIGDESAAKRSSLPAPMLQPPKPKPEAVVIPSNLETREQHIQEMCQKLGDSVRLFNKRRTDSRFKVEIPIQNKQGLPSLWTLDNKTVDVFLTVPVDYAGEKSAVSFASNFSTNLVVAKKALLETQNTPLPELVQTARVAENNFKVNANRWLTLQETSLVQSLNWVALNLTQLVRPVPEFDTWLLQMESLHKGLSVGGS